MKPLLLSFLLAFTVSGKAQPSCDIRDSYRFFVKADIITHKGERYLTRTVVAADSGICQHKFINRNKGFLQYLLTHFASESNKPQLLGVPDSISLRKAAAEELKQDSLFSGLMLELTAKSIDGSQPKDTVTLDALLDIAVKYFSVRRITDEESYAVKVCAGLNDIVSTEPVRKPFVEAFCFSTILIKYTDGTDSLQQEFIRNVQELYKLNLGIDRNERLLRAQGALYMLMRNSTFLRNMLLAEYRKKRADLPFVLTAP